MTRWSARTLSKYITMVKSNMTTLPCLDRPAGPTFARVGTRQEFDPKAVASAIRRLRNEQGLTQSQLAEAAGLADETVSRVEGGREPPNLRTALRIADALGRPLDEVVGRSPPGRESPSDDDQRARHDQALKTLTDALANLPIDVLEDIRRMVGHVARGRRR